MVLHEDKDVKEIQIEMEGAEGVVKRVLIGVEDGSLDIIMRLFRVKPGGHTPRHTHPFPHVVKWISGKGIIIDNEGTGSEIEVGMSAFIPGNEEHQFKNPYKKECSFLCIIPNPEKME